ncbi:uncharacterized protein LOC134635570 [Pelmatolapia mariae]|uniref:uncharacterized protein LOC134635570 n=1 Tax=Pelmatolapia mariae TaxID=158779 RepID=UPI002FE5ACF4
MMTKELLAETLNQLSPEDFAEFKSHIEEQKDFPLISKRRVKVANVQDVVELIEKICRRDRVSVTRKALMKINRMAGEQRLSDKQFPPLSQRVETMKSVMKLLLVTLADLSDSELKDLEQMLKMKCESVLQFVERDTDLQDTVFIVFIVVQMFGYQSVEEVMEVLKEMKRTDLAQRLADGSSETKKKRMDENLSPLIHKVATMAAVTDLLLETLEDLSERDLMEFKWFLQFTRFQKSLPQILLRTDTKEIVILMIETWGQQSVEVIIEVFRDMKRADLVQRLSESSSGFNEKHDERCPALIQKIEMMEFVIELLLETLACLNVWELNDFKEILHQIHCQKNYSYIRWMLYMTTDLQDTVFFMVQIYGYQSVEKTIEGLKEMKRTDLSQRLSDCSSLPRKKHSVDERRSALIHKVATMAAVKHLLLETLKDLNNTELKKFKSLWR